MSPPRVPIQKVALAKALMRRGAPLTGTASALNLNSCDLDRALWLTLGQPLTEHLPPELQRRTAR